MTDLTPSQCEQVLARNYYGHLGCTVDGYPYVVPITYVYKQNVLYGYTLEGLKVEAMRRDPRVCVQVEHVQSGSEWESVLCWGTFEEIVDADTKQNARLLLADVHGQVLMQGEASPVSPLIANLNDNERYDGVIYRIAVERMTGKQEMSHI